PAAAPILDSDEEAEMIAETLPRAQQRSDSRMLWSRALASLLSLALASWIAWPAAAQTSGRKKEPAPVAPFALDAFNSTHILLHTVLSPVEAKELLGRLEKMLALISAYWRRPPSGVIECYVAKDIKRWPADLIDPHGRAKIEQGAGVT